MTVASARADVHPHPSEELGEAPASDFMSRLDAAASYRGLRPSEHATLQALVRHTDERGYCRIKQATIRKRTDYSERSTRDAIHRLQDLGLIGASWRVRLDANHFSCTRYVLDLSELGLLCAPDPIDVAREQMRREPGALAHVHGVELGEREGEPTAQPDESPDQLEASREALKAEVERLRAECRRKRRELAGLEEHQDQQAHERPALTGNPYRHSVAATEEVPAGQCEEGANAPSGAAARDEREGQENAGAAGGESSDDKPENQERRTAAEGRQRTTSAAQDGAGGVLEALRRLTEPLPSTDSAQIRQKRTVVRLVAALLEQGWTPAKLRREIIEAYDERGRQWPPEGADNPPGLMLHRLDQAVKREQREAARDDRDQDRTVEPCPVCDDERTIVTDEEDPWALVVTCPECSDERGELGH